MNDTKMTKEEKIQNNDIFLANPSILIVEDESILALGLECSLENFGYEVSGIETTYENAVAHVKENLPDLVLMDINLKGEKSGIEAAKYIWKSFKIPIVFLTSYADDKTLSDALDSEPYGYIIKPYKDKELKAVVKTALHKHKYFFKNKDSLSEHALIKLGEQIFFDKAKGILIIDQDKVTLTKNEVRLFEIATEFLDESISYEKISDYIYREDLYDLGKLRALIYRVKKKVGTDLFENVYEFGYKLKSYQG